MVLELTEDDDYELDFNRAFNPYCAYTEAFECAFPPSENDLPVAVRAGEQAWAVDRNPRTPFGAVPALASTPTPKPRRKPDARATSRTPPKRAPHRAARSKRR
jgi:Protein of unknown function (DUF1684)